MTPTPTTDEWGIDASWLDALDEEHSVAQATIDRLREVSGTPPPDLPVKAFRELATQSSDAASDLKSSDRASWNA